MAKKIVSLVVTLVLILSADGYCGDETFGKFESMQ